MNKRQRLMYTVAKSYHQAIEENSNRIIPFKKHYREVKWSYRNESDAYLKDILKWTRSQIKSKV